MKVVEHNGKFYIVLPYEEPYIQLLDILDLIERKNKYYGDSYKDLGYLFMVYRIIDKCNRMKNMILKKDELGTTEEDLQEEIRDIIGYGILMLKNKGGRWL